MSIRDDQHYLQVVDAFQRAALDVNGWSPALEALATATGSQSGELICVGADTRVPLNVITNVDPELPAAFLAVGGGDPKVNPRVRAGMCNPVLKVMAENDFISVDEYKRDPHYQEFARPWGIPYICLATLDRREEMLIGLAVLRSEREGHIDAVGRRAFTALAPHVRAAVRTHIALEGHGDALISGTLEALEMPAFICDSKGYVRQLTEAAERIVTGERGLQLRQGRLVAGQASESEALSDAIASALVEQGTIGSSPRRSVVIRASERDRTPLVLDIVPLPNQQQFSFNFKPRVLVLIRGLGAAGNQRRVAILRTAYGMTSAEADIAMQLFAGQSPENIADARNVSLGTVRAQIKALLAKAGVRRQVELVARLGTL